MSWATEKAAGRQRVGSSREKERAPSNEMIKSNFSKKVHDATAIYILQNFNDFRVKLEPLDT